MGLYVNYMLAGTLTSEAEGNEIQVYWGTANNLFIVWGAGLASVYKLIIHGVYEKVFWVYDVSTELSYKVRQMCGKEHVGGVRSRYPKLSRWQRLYLNTNIVLVSLSLGILTNSIFHLLRAHALRTKLLERVRGGKEIPVEIIAEKILGHMSICVSRGGLLCCTWVMLGALIQWKSKKLSFWANTKGFYWRHFVAPKVKKSRWKQHSQ